MKRIVAVNASPRTEWNTASLVRAAAKGCAEAGSEVKVYDLYRLAPYTGCISCFGCKTEGHLGTCICKDGLSELLSDLREADGIILGSPNYLGDVSSALRALYERMIFPLITYKSEPRSYATRSVPVLLIMTSNCAEDFYPAMGYDAMLARYRDTLSAFLGPTRLLICGDTLQVKDYDRYGWSMFDPEAKKARHETAFPEALARAKEYGGEMVRGEWSPKP